MSGSPSPRTPTPSQDEMTVTSRRTFIPDAVKPTRDDGVEEQALSLAELFFNAQKTLCHRTQKRGELSQLFVSTFDSWAPEDVKHDTSLKRPFKQILFALAHGMKVLRVVDSGRRLLWKANRPRYDERRDGQRYSGRRYDERRDGGRRYDDRRDGERRYDDRRDGGRRYDDRRDGGRRYDERRDGGHRYDERRDGGRRYDDRRDGARRRLDFDGTETPR